MRRIGGRADRAGLHCATEHQGGTETDDGRKGKMHHQLLGWELSDTDVLGMRTLAACKQAGKRRIGSGLSTKVDGLLAAAAQQGNTGFLPAWPLLDQADQPLGRRGAVDPAEYARGGQPLEFGRAVQRRKQQLHRRIGHSSAAASAVSASVLPADVAQVAAKRPGSPRPKRAASRTRCRSVLVSSSHKLADRRGVGDPRQRADRRNVQLGNGSPPAAGPARRQSCRSLPKVARRRFARRAGRRPGSNGAGLHFPTGQSRKASARRAGSVSESAIRRLTAAFTGSCFIGSCFLSAIGILFGRSPAASRRLFGGLCGVRRGIRSDAGSRFASLSAMRQGGQQHLSSSLGRTNEDGSIRVVRRPLRSCGGETETTDGRKGDEAMGRRAMRGNGDSWTGVFCLRTGCLAVLSWVDRFLPMVQPAPANGCTQQERGRDGQQGDPTLEPISPTPSGPDFVPMFCERVPRATGVAAGQRASLSNWSSGSSPTGRGDFRDRRSCQRSAK